MTHCRTPGCHHAERAHRHFRRGTDCSQCDCTSFRRFRLLALLPAPRRNPRPVSATTEVRIPAPRADSETTQHV